MAIPVPVVLTIAKWNQVLEILSSQPWKEINPLLVDIHQQLQNGMTPIPHLGVVKQA